MQFTQILDRFRPLTGISSIAYFLRSTEGTPSTPARKAAISWNRASPILTRQISACSVFFVKLTVLDFFCSLTGQILNRGQAAQWSLANLAVWVSLSALYSADCGANPAWQVQIWPFSLMVNSLTPSRPSLVFFPVKAEKLISIPLASAFSTVSTE